MALGVLTALLSAPPAPAQAASNWRTYNQSYTVARDFYSKDIKRCFHIVMSGTMRFQQTYYWRGKYKLSDYRNPRLVNPRLEVFTKTSCARGARLVRSKGADLTQAWYDTGCRVTPTIGAGVPWTLYADLSLSCERRKIASRTTTPRNAKGQTSYFQSNSGTPPVLWKKLITFKRICVRTSAIVTVYTKNGSDTKDLSDVTICGSIQVE